MTFTLNDIPREETVYVVFRGTPIAVYDRSPEGHEESREHAAKLARQTEESYTIVCVPRVSLKVGSVARYMGVVIDILNDSDMREENC